MKIIVDSLIKNKKHRLILYKEMLEYIQWCKEGRSYRFERYLTLNKSHIGNVVLVSSNN